MELKTSAGLIRLTRFARERGIPERTLRDWQRRKLLTLTSGLHHVGTIVFIDPKEFDSFFLDNEDLMSIRKRGRKKKTPLREIKIVTPVPEIPAQE